MIASINFIKIVIKILCSSNARKFIYTLININNRCIQDIYLQNIYLQELK